MARYEPSYDSNYKNSPTGRDQLSSMQLATLNGQQLGGGVLIWQRGAAALATSDKEQHKPKRAE